jgi:threonine dehydratase
VILHESDRASMVARTEKLAADDGLALVRPFDDPAVISGQGTVGIELAAQLGEVSARPDAVLVPCGGGGLTAGIATVLERDLPGVPIHTVEPEGFDDTARSLAAGERLAIVPGATSICDALLVPQPGVLTFPINHRLAARGLSVTDAAVRAAIAAAFAHLKLVVEPGGAVALAAVLSGALDCRGKTVAVIASGGNVEPAVFADALGAAS